MKLRDYSLRIKKDIALVLHVLFLAVSLAGISAMYLESGVGQGIFWIFDQEYEETPQFAGQFEEDMASVFRYTVYRDVFETDGSLDLSREMFSVTRGEGPEIIYSLEEVLRYARSQGFYLNDQFEVVNDLFIYDEASSARDQRVNWRAYNPNATLSEPGDAYTSLLDLSREVLDCLSEYYTVTYRMIVNPSNFRFRVVYETEDDEYVYTNAGEMDEGALRDLGWYVALSSEDIVLDSNLAQVPKNIPGLMEESGFYDMDAYSVVMAVDKNFAADDIYADQREAYELRRQRFREAFACLAVGIAGCLVTLLYMMATTGYRTGDRKEPYLYEFDTITTEACLVLTAVFTLFMLFLGEKIGYKLLHLLVREAAWDYASKLLQIVIIYACCMAGFFSLLRRMRSRTLWENSILHHLQENVSEFLAEGAFTSRLFWLYLAFLAAQLLGFGGLAAAYKCRALSWAPAAAVLAALFLLGVDWAAYRRLFSASAQEDEIASAIEKIAGGDTSYQMDVSRLTGKELELGRLINTIGTGLEQALNDQVRSERLKADLITNVSHDIKTPLTSIINYVDLLKRENLPGERTQEYIRVLEQKSQRLKNLTEDLVEASKASSGNVQLEMTTLDIVEMIWQTNGEFEEKFADRGLEIAARLPGQGILIEADGRHLWRVLENVYNNAYKYAMENTRVFTELEQAGDQVFFTIKNMSAMPLNVQGEELTERFVRGDVSRTTEGSGLGLSIAQSLTNLQGGSFDIIVDGDMFKVKIGFSVKET